MMENKELSFEERKQIQLEMLDEIDIFCSKNNIRYSLAFGTLLGSIRHHGFIPWDDDVDIMMPLEDLLKFKSTFASEKLDYHDIDNTPDYYYHFSRISHKGTYSQYGKIVKRYGICIDVYILINVPDSKKMRDAFFSTLSRIQKPRLFLMGWSSKIQRHLPIASGVPFTRFFARKYRATYFKNRFEGSNTYYILAGPLTLRDKMTYTHDLFEKTIKVEFEGKNYSAISCYDEYLTLRYGKYMELPPIDQRNPYHGNRYYNK